MAKGIRRATDSVRFPVRMDRSLQIRLEKAAAKSGRSMNLEVIERLEGSFKGKWQESDQAKLLAETEAMVDELRELVKFLADRVAKVRAEDK